MSDKRASTDLLDELHAAIAHSLIDKIRSGEATASDLNVARQFVKDNGIDAVPGKENPASQLADELPDVDSAVVVPIR
jgi:hypothetical protein